MSESLGSALIAAVFGGFLLLPSMDLQNLLRDQLGIAPRGPLPPVVRIEGVPHPGWYEADDLGAAVRQAGGKVPLWVNEQVQTGDRLTVLGDWLVVEHDRGIQADTVREPALEPHRALGRKIPINTASAAELEVLPAVGPTMARRIIEGRPYRRLADLDRVKGIGEKTLEKLRPWVEF